MTATRLDKRIDRQSSGLVRWLGTLPGSLRRLLSRLFGARAAGPEDAGDPAAGTKLAAVQHLFLWALGTAEGDLVVEVS